MPTKTAEIRIRPQAATVLIARNESADRFGLCVRFLSQLWGGRHFKILVVDESTPQLACETLAVLRPEFVFGIGIDESLWSTKLIETCQPRGFGTLTEEFVSNLVDAHVEQFYLIHHVLVQAAREKQRQASDHYRKIISVECNVDSNILMLYSAFFGVNAGNIKPPIIDQVYQQGDSSFDAFLDLIITFKEKSWLSILDLTRHKLKIASSLRSIPPTIVLVETWHDLALYWNLQSMEGHCHPGWVIPIPANEELSSSSLEKISRWFELCAYDDLQSNYWWITSVSLSKESCDLFAAKLEERLKGSRIEIVEYAPPDYDAALSIPFEYRSKVPVERNGRRIAFTMPSTKAFSEQVGRGAHMIDLLLDVSNGRALMEMQLPPTHVVSELLNCPSPPSYSYSHLKTVGDGPECVSIRCTDPESKFELYCPTAFEIIDETMRSGGYEGVHDEKRSIYGPVIRMFGGVNQAASDLSANCGKVLRFVCEKPRSVTAIKEHIRIGGADVEPMPYATRITNMLQRQSELVKRVGLSRFKRYASGSRPSETKLEEILEYWVKKGVMRRTMKIGPCTHCRREFYADSISLLQSVSCQFCGKTTRIQSTIAMSYALDPRVALAINEGLAPVAQTARFLCNLTSKGFFYLPGYKFKTASNARGDVDLIAICDGQLVFCECKNLEGTSDSSGELTSDSEVMNQFRKTIEVALQCNGSAAVFASRMEQYREDLENCLEKEFGNRLAIRFLNKSDLDSGFRQPGDVFTRMSLSDLVSRADEKISPPQVRLGRRVIRSRWFVQTDG